MTRDFSTLSFSCVLMFTSINAAAAALAVVDVIPHRRTHSHARTDVEQLSSHTEFQARWQANRTSNKSAYKIKQNKEISHFLFIFLPSLERARTHTKMQNEAATLSVIKCM